MASYRDSDAHQSPLRVRTINQSEVTPEIIGAWAELESRALQPNAYLSPYFVLPAIRNFSRESKHLIVLVESLAPAQLLGIGVFEFKTFSVHLPLPHLRAYRSHHSYEDGFLIDRRHSIVILDSLCNYLYKDGSPWHSVVFARLPSDTIFSKTMNSLARKQMFNWHELKRFRRPILKPTEAGEHYLRTRLKKRYKDCSRLLRRLSKYGHVTWHYIAGNDISTETVEHFLELEHMGWKGKAGSSLASHVHETAFFHEMVAGFRKDGRVFFAELRLDGRAISSSCNLLSGNAGFAFKIGWHTDYAHSSPGILNEVELIRHAPECCRDLEFIDSGASPGAYIERLWLDSRPMVSGTYASSCIMSNVVKIMNTIQRGIPALFQR